MLVDLVEIAQPLEGADADVRVAEAHQHRRARRRGLVAAHQLLAGLDQAEGLRGVDASASSISVASTSRTPPFSVSRPSALRDQGVRPRALGAEVEQPAVLEIVQLREEEAAAVAESGL